MRGIGQIDIGAMSKSRSMSASPTWVRGRGCRSPALPRHSDHGAPSIAISASTKVWLNDAVAPTHIEHLADVAEQHDARILIATAASRARLPTRTARGAEQIRQI